MSVIFRARRRGHCPECDGPILPGDYVIYLDEDMVHAHHDTHLSPDCAAGEKHKACSGDAWNHDTDQPTPCTCPCHTQSKETVS